MPEMQFEKEVLERLTKIETKLDSYGNVKAKTYENEKHIIAIENDLEEVRNRIISIEETSKWLSRAIWGAVISALVGLLFTLVQMGVRI